MLPLVSESLELGMSVYEDACVEGRKLEVVAPLVGKTGCIGGGLLGTRRHISFHYFFPLRLGVYGTCCLLRASSGTIAAGIQQVWRFTLVRRWCKRVTLGLGRLRVRMGCVQCCRLV